MVLKIYLVKLKKQIKMNIRLFHIDCNFQLSIIKKHIRYIYLLVPPPPWHHWYVYSSVSNAISLLFITDRTCIIISNISNSGWNNRNKNYIFFSHQSTQTVYFVSINSRDDCHGIEFVWQLTCPGAMCVMVQ